MVKLVGMLVQFGRGYWPIMERDIGSRRPESRMPLDSMVFEYCIPAGSGTPKVFERYIRAVNHGHESEYEQEEQRCLAGSARFLRSMKKETYSLMSQTEDENKIEELRNVEAYIV